MLAKRIIPCLDVHAGRVVKGVNFLNLRDAGDPVEVAARYEEQGADELVFLDITASHEEREIMLEVVRRTSEMVFMPLCVGGGIRTLEDIRRLLAAGCDKVSINSAAVRNPDFVREAALRFGSQCIVVNIDPKRVPAEEARERMEARRSEVRRQRIEDRGSRIEDRAPQKVEDSKSRRVEEETPTQSPQDSATLRLCKSATADPLTTGQIWEVHINGGRIPTGLEAVSWAREVERLGAGEIVLTSMDADGTQDGYDIEMTKAVAAAVNIPVVASGGAGSPEHLYRALTEGGASAALAASIFHYGTYTINETKDYLRERGVPVRYNVAV